MNREEKHEIVEAIALKYDETKHDAPKVIAKGQGNVAENIIEKARENDIPIYEDRNLVELLGKLNINESIPDELYSAVAEVFAFIYKTDQKAGKRKE
jgi:flagellar biosynthesis protein